MNIDLIQISTMLNYKTWIEEHNVSISEISVCICADDEFSWLGLKNIWNYSNELTINNRSSKIDWMTWKKARKTYIEID